MSETTQQTPLSGVVAFKTGLKIATPFNKHGFTALLKTLLFYGVGYVALFWLWLYLMPLGADGLIPLSLSFGQGSIPIATIIFYLLCFVPFVIFYPVRCVLTGRRDHPYFKDVGTPLFTRAVCVSLLVLPGVAAFEAMEMFGLEYLWLITVILYFFFAAYLILVLVHLTATGRVDFGTCWGLYKQAPFKYTAASWGAFFTLLIPFVLVAFVLIAIVFLCGLLYLAFVDGNPDLFFEDFMALLMGEGIGAHVLPYACVFLWPIGIMCGFYVWTSVGFYGAVAALYRDQNPQAKVSL